MPVNTDDRTRLLAVTPSAIERLEEGASVTLRLAATPPIVKPTMLNLTVTGGLELNTDTTLLLDRLNPSAAVMVTAIDNVAVDGTQTAAVNFDITATNTEPQNIRVTINITDNDRYTIAFADPRLSIAEGASGQATLTIDPIPTVPIAVTLNPSTTALTLTPPSITFAPGVSQQNLDIAVTDDNVDQTEEQQHTVEIVLDDPSAPLTAGAPLTVVVPRDLDDQTVSLAVSPARIDALDEGTSTQLIVFSDLDIVSPATLTLGVDNELITVNPEQITIRPGQARDRLAVFTVMSVDNDQVDTGSVSYTHLTLPTKA